LRIHADSAELWRNSISMPNTGFNRVARAGWRSGGICAQPELPFMAIHARARRQRAAAFVMPALGEPRVDD
jgi:hypothetical protein